jgi:hypothetical protein
MHNLISFNQLSGWQHLEKTIDDFKENQDLMNDYFECLTECDENSQTCRKICKYILSA